MNVASSAPLEGQAYHHGHGDPTAASVENDGTNNNGANNNAEMPYRPLAEHFSHHGGETMDSALPTSGATPEGRYSPIYGKKPDAFGVRDSAVHKQASMTPMLTL